jgi:hypothetical protein
MLVGSDKKPVYGDKRTNMWSQNGTALVYSNTVQAALRQFFSRPFTDNLESSANELGEIMRQSDKRSSTWK